MAEAAASAGRYGPAADAVPDWKRTRKGAFFVFASGEAGPAGVTLAGGGTTPIVVAIFEAMAAVFPVLLEAGYGAAPAIVMGAIAAAAATIMVIRRRQAKGPVTEMHLSVVAPDDAVALITVSARAVPAYAPLLRAVVPRADMVYEITGSAVTKFPRIKGLENQEGMAFSGRFGKRHAGFSAGSGKIKDMEAHGPGRGKSRPREK